MLLSDIPESPHYTSLLFLIEPIEPRQQLGLQVASCIKESSRKIEFIGQAFDQLRIRHPLTHLVAVHSGASGSRVNPDTDSQLLL